MGTAGLCVALVVLAAGSALAQYGPSQQQQQVPGFTPVQAKDCDTQHACIYWEYCHNGEINTGGIGKLDVRTLKPIPAGYGQPTCSNGPNNICCKIPDILWQEQTGGWQGQCAVHHSCVPAYQCLNGIINTSGVGLLDPRIKPSGVKPLQSCTSEDPRYAGVPGVCCQLPEPHPVLTCSKGLRCNDELQCAGTIPIGPDGSYTRCYTNTATAELGVCCNDPIPEPIRICPVDQVCVTQEVCTGQGQVNTDGTGLIDIRINLPCYLDNSLTGTGVCCNPPIIEVVNECPGGGSHVCRSPDVCQGTTLLDAYGRALSCYLGDGSTGLCCESPEPVNFCSNTNEYFCAPAGSCQGSILPDIYGGDQACYLEGGQGVCCETPRPATSCSADTAFFCAETGTCQGQTKLDIYDGIQSCYLGGGSTVGECCESPRVPTCPGGDICVPFGDCAGITVVNDYGNELYCDLGKGVTGTCCSPIACSVEDKCLTEDRCDAQATDLSTATNCYLPDTVTVGKCCKPKPPPISIRDTCPDDSVCLPDILCQGDILSLDDQFYPYSTDKSWAQCRVSGSGLASPGVCCRNLVIVPDLPPPAQKCGVRNYGLDQRVQTPKGPHNNYQAQFAEFPWQAIVFFTNFTFKCGASLIGDGWLLTAAHCVNGYTAQDLMVRLGEWKVDSYDEPGNYLDVGIHSIYVHPGFNSGNLHNDIALIRLQKSVNFQYHINAVCLPEQGQLFYDQTRCYATGWGKDAFDGGEYQVIMKKVDLPLVNHEECQQYLRKTRLGPFFILDKSFLCAGGEEGKDACEGDGGGPLVCQDPSTGRYILTGITAWGIGCGQKNVPGVFVNVEYFHSWINDILFSPQHQQTTGVYGK